MPPVITGFTRDLGLHVVEPGSLTAPPDQPETTTPPSAEGQPQPDAGSVPAEPGSVPQPETDDDSAITSVFTDPGQKKDRPFVARIMRENGSLQTRLSAVEAQSTAKDAQIAQLLEQLQRAAGGQPTQQPGMTTPTPSPQPSLAPPRPEDFNGDAPAFGRALEVYWRQMAAQEAQQVVTAVLKEHTARQEQEAQETLREAVGRKLREGQQLYPDFSQALPILEAVIAPAGLLPAFMQYVAQSTGAVQVIRHLANHPEALQDLAERHAAGATRYLHQLEAQLQRPSAATSTPTPPVPSRVTQTPSFPPPVQPLRGGGGALVPPTPATNANAVVEHGGSVADYMRALWSPR